MNGYLQKGYETGVSKREKRVIHSLVGAWTRKLQPIDVLRPSRFV